jgi:hypothetical protein
MTDIPEINSKKPLMMPDGHQRPSIVLTRNMYPQRREFKGTHRSAKPRRLYMKGYSISLVKYRANPFIGF